MSQLPPPEVVIPGRGGLDLHDCLRIPSPTTSQRRWISLRTKLMKYDMELSCILRNTARVPLAFTKSESCVAQWF